jgi:hypothetical protein
MQSVEIEAALTIAQPFGISYLGIFVRHPGNDGEKDALFKFILNSFSFFSLIVQENVISSSHRRAW